jgi:hypothetical protein
MPPSAPALPEPPTIVADPAAEIPAEEPPAVEELPAAPEFEEPAVAVEGPTPEPLVEEPVAVEEPPPALAPPVVEEPPAAPEAMPAFEEPPVVVEEPPAEAMPTQILVIPERRPLEDLSSRDSSASARRRRVQRTMAPPPPPPDPVWPLARIAPLGMSSKLVAAVVIALTVVGLVSWWFLNASQPSEVARAYWQAMQDQNLEAMHRLTAPGTTTDDGVLFPTMSLTHYDVSPGSEVLGDTARVPAAIRVAIDLNLVAEERLLAAARLRTTVAEPVDVKLVLLRHGRTWRVDQRQTRAGVRQALFGDRLPLAQGALGKQGD